MKRSERGFTLIELLVVMAIVALIAGAATMSIFQVINVTRSTNDHMTAIRQAQNAGYWISRDALKAEHMIIGDDPEATFLNLTWTEWGFGGGSIYHSVTYSLDLSGGIGELERQHLIYDDEGVEIGNTTTFVAEYIYYTDDLENTMVAYTDLVLTARITALFGEATETKEYKIWPRPNF